MWLSNTATTAMLIPILEAVLIELERHKNMPEVVKDVEHGEDFALIFWPSFVNRTPTSIFY